MVTTSVQAPAYEKLKQLLKEARYDEALVAVEGYDARTIFAGVRDPLQRLRWACMCSDVLDYGGLHARAELMIRNAGQDAYERLKTVTAAVDIPEAAYAKQECWAVLLLGMSFHRRFDYDGALKLFERARDVLLILDRSGSITCTGTLARAWYCIGLVEREKHEYRTACNAFKKSLELTERGIAERRKKNESTVSFEYNMARCQGLGIGWIAYNQASLNEAMSALVIARHLMASKEAKFITAYIDLVQASIIMSESNDIDRIDEAIRIL